ncbi:MAG: hypothetical protein K9I02_02650, partial [Haliscomenobacter sp.]|nr:hypothetical protein [Haliscomenobacter sp.]
IDNQYILNIFILHYSLINLSFAKLSTGCSNYVDGKICTIEIGRLNCTRFHYHTKNKLLPLLEKRNLT